MTNKPVTMLQKTAANIPAVGIALALGALALIMIIGALFTPVAGTREYELTQQGVYGLAAAFTGVSVLFVELVYASHPRHMQWIAAALIIGGGLVAISASAELIALQALGTC